MIESQEAIQEKLQVVEHWSSVCCPGCRMLLEDVTTRMMRFDQTLDEIRSVGPSGLFKLLTGRGGKKVKENAAGIQHEESSE